MFHYTFTIKMKIYVFFMLHRAFIFTVYLLFQFFQLWNNNYCERTIPQKVWKILYRCQRRMSGACPEKNGKRLVGGEKEGWLTEWLTKSKIVTAMRFVEVVAKMKWRLQSWQFWNTPLWMIQYRLKNSTSILTIDGVDIGRTL